MPSADKLAYFKNNKFDLVARAGYMQILPENVLTEMGKVINIHPSLLPAFKGKDGNKTAFLAGFKISGITIHYVDKKIDSGKIIAQYPIFIQNGAHLDEVEAKSTRLSTSFIQLLLKKCWKIKFFDFKTL